MRIKTTALLITLFLVHDADGYIANHFRPRCANTLRDQPLAGRWLLSSLMAGDHVDDPFEVESNPLDDEEPEAHQYNRTPPPAASRGISSGPTPRPNPYNIPTDPVGEWEWYYQRLKARHDAIQQYGTDENVAIDVVEESLLRHWMAQQRKMLMKTLGVLDLGQEKNWGTAYLTREKKERLDAAGKCRTFILFCMFAYGCLSPTQFDTTRI